MKQKKESGLGYLELALLAFGGLGLEVLLAFVIEPVLYGGQMNEWSVFQSILHWIFTCIIWAIVIGALIIRAKNICNFDIFQKNQTLKAWQWAGVAVCIIFSLVMSYLDWEGFKVVKEFQYNGWLKFIFQYIYYIFETGLVVLIVIFGQKAFEVWFKKANIPYGGIIAAITWGLAHIFTKGDIVAGIVCAISGFLFGAVYLLVNRNIRITFPVLLIMFIM